MTDTFEARARRGKLSPVAMTVARAVFGEIPPPRRNATFEQRVAELADWVAEHGAWPRLPPAEADAAELTLGRWLAQQRTAARGNGRSSVVFSASNRGALLDAALPGWRDRDHFRTA